MMKSIFKLRSSLPKYTANYDLDLVLQYMNQIPDNHQLILEILVMDIATLLCLLIE